MKTNLFIFLLLTIFCFAVSAQDTLYYKTGRKVAVKILNETSKEVSVHNYNDTSISNIYKVYKKYLIGTLYEKESSRFEVMTPSEFSSLGKKHAKNYGTALDVLAKNTDYMSGFENELHSEKLIRTAGYCLLGFLIIIPAVAAATDSGD